MWGVALAEIILSLRAEWFTNQAFYVHDMTLKVLSWGAFATAALLAFVPPARVAVERCFAAVDALSPRLRVFWLASATLALFAQTSFIKYCQYRGFQLPMDTAATANIAYNFLHHGTFESSIFGLPSYYAVHFMPVIALFAPLLLFCNSALTLLFAQQALVASMPAALFLMVRGAGGSALAAAAAFWLGWTNSFFQDLTSTSIALQVALPAFFLWGMHLLESRRIWAGVTALVLMTLCIEQAPFTLFGLGLYLLFRPGRRLPALALCLGSALLFGAEMKFILAHPEAPLFRDWSMFAHLGPDPASALRSALTHPWNFALKLLWPPAKLEPLWRMFYTTAFLGLLAPTRLLPWAVNYLPNFLSAPGSFYNLVILHYPAYVMGPLWWASAHGAARAAGFMQERRWSGFLLAAALLVSGFSLRGSTRILLPERSEQSFKDGPSVVAHVPPAAAVWISEFLSPALSARSFIKVLPLRGEDPSFAMNLFVPDYILLSKGFITLGDPTFRMRMAAFIRQEGYKKVVEAPSIYLLRHPRAPLAPPGGRPPAATLPQPQKGVDFAVQVTQSK
jgi:hypothetical protein